MDGSGDEVRKALSKAVRPIYGPEQPGWSLRTALKKKAFELGIKKLYKECSEKTGESFRDCLKKIAAEKNLASAYFQVWFGSMS